MSYCRWSSDDYQCDAYVYETYEGLAVALAANRVVFDRPLPPPVDVVGITSPGAIEAYVARSQVVSTMLDRAARVPIQHPEAGQMHLFQNWLEAADFIDRMREEGFNIPADVSRVIRNDARDQAKEP